MTYRALFSGSRHWDDPYRVQAVIDELPPEAVIVVGDCPTGVDRTVRDHAADLGRATEVHAADWSAHGKAAGPLRNQQMVDAGADEAHFFITAAARGTRHCLDAARRAGIPTHVHQET